MHIAIDAMGGDLGPRATVQGTSEALTAHPELWVRLYGPQKVLHDELSRLPRRLQATRARLNVVHAPDVVSQDMKLTRVLRAPRTSSLAMMLDDLASGRADAGVSAGNTAALMALSRRALGTVAGIPRPAISTAIPTRNGGRCYMLDMGANIEASASRLVEFALMGDIMARRVDDLSRPRVALLNVGVEATKGTVSVRAADTMLRELPGINYIGFIEGDGLFSGAADVVVCDGFVGNVVLKASEGLAQMLIGRMQATFHAHWGSRLVGLLARPALQRLRGQLDPVRYNGASLLGLSGIVVKSHGRASALGFTYAISRSMQEVRINLPMHLERELGQRAILAKEAGTSCCLGGESCSRTDDPNI
nr:phosphate acyltransferase PlsX [uncultured Halomonas sp.]